MGGLEVAMLAALAVLFVPGFLALRVMGTPRAWAAAIPSACRLRMDSRSTWAT